MSEPAWITETCVCPSVPFAVVRRRAQVRRAQQKLRTKLYGLLDYLRDGPCQSCDSATPPMQFAHVSPTAVVGRGRGKVARAYDLLHHPASYRRLCLVCHRRLDA